jgi:hypothetical protein
MNKPTEDPNDRDTRTKKQQIIEAVSSLLAKHPTYKVYVTGHSLGAALSTLASYYLATTLRTAVHPITCINFASPRVGDGVFLEAVQQLERQNRLRICRFVNDNDLVCVIPTINYKHVGFMVKLKRQYHPSIDICYPKVDEGMAQWIRRAWGMSWPVAMNLTYDHSIGEYGRRIELHRKELQRLDLETMYRNDKWTGCVDEQKRGRQRLPKQANRDRNKTRKKKGAGQPKRVEI